MSSANSSLRPAWHRGNNPTGGGGKGFQPPPAVASERGRSSSDAARRDSNFNAFSALDDDEDAAAATAAAVVVDEDEDVPKSNSRSEGLRAQRSVTTGSMSTNNKPAISSGRSLADLAARAPERTTNRFSKTDSEAAAKVIRYTREKLLSMRPAPSTTLPEELNGLEGTVVISKEPQDPVCWDNLDAEEIWAAVPRRTSTVKGAAAAADGGGGGGTENRRASAARSSGGGGAGRWQRGVALPPPDQVKKGQKDASNPNELWDDPNSTAPSADFSGFGAIPEDGEAFDFEKVAEASKKFGEELHGSSRSRTSSDADNDEDENVHSVKVNPNRPLASIGTTIRSGSGDDVNVFEDFDDPADENGQPMDSETAGTEPAAIKGAEEDPSASSRLMAMIGVKKDEPAPPQPPPVTTTESPVISATPADPPKVVSPWGPTGTAAPRPSDSMGISLNPWGAPLIPTPAQNEIPGMTIQAQMRGASELEAQKRHAEELRRRQEQEEAQRRLAIQQHEERARQAAIQQQQQQQQQQLGVQSQVEYVLLERISTILENSWGRSDLMSILSTLHAEDSRVIPLLNNVDLLRALILRHPQRVTIRHDPAFGAELAILVMSNAQWQQQEAQAAQARAQQEEMQLRQQQQRQAEEQQKAAAAASATHGPMPMSPTAPWFYSDPQNNIQGPFRGHEMRQWLEAGYFKGDLPISQQRGGPFRPLSMIFPNLAAAFMVADYVQEDPRVKAEAEERERVEAEMARLAEAEARNREIAERGRRAQAAAEQERFVAEQAEKSRREDQANSSNGGNQSSNQLKLMLGLGQAGVATQATTEPSAEVLQPRANDRRTKAANNKSAQPRSQPLSMPEPPGKVSSSPPAPAWGGATQNVSRKSMSEIQKEEARAAAIAAMQRESSRPSGSGWANVAASRGGSTAWSGGAAKPTAGALLQNPSAGGGVNIAQRQAASNVSHPMNRQSSTSSQSQSNVAEEFGAKMSPGLEKWCKDQMQKLNGSDDLTLVSFCMTLNDAAEVRQYLTAYLGSNPQVNSFATEFINKRGLGSGKQEEWESTATVKKARKKKVGSR